MNRIKYIKHLEDADYISEIDAAVARGSHRYARVMLFTIFLLVLCALFWAHFAKIEAVTRGMGRVVPSSDVQVIQNLEGGIIREILVKEGDTVERNQVLMRIDNRSAEAMFAGSETKYFKTMAEVARLEAEVGGQSTISFPPELLAAAPEIADQEQALFENRLDELSNSIKILENEVEQKRQIVATAKSQLERTQRSLALVREQYNINKPLADQGLVARSDILAQQRELNDLESQVDNIRLSIPREEAAMQGAEQRVDQQKRAFMTESRTQLNQKRAELQAVKAQIGAEGDRVSRTEVRSPVRGSVQELKISTIGGVIPPGGQLLAIIPLDDTLLVEADIRPQDIADIHVEQKANIKITAYDFTTWGGLEGHVISISPDTFTNDRGESFYRVKLRTNKNYVGKDSTKRFIIPGMVAQVDILSDDKRTVLNYILKPFRRARANALTEK